MFFDKFKKSSVSPEIKKPEISPPPSDAKELDKFIENIKNI